MQNDVRLVTGNAKAFNPPGTIYHSEAERIEQYAVDHINRAAATVIEHEGDWNIDVEQEDEADFRASVEGEDVRGTPMEVDRSSRARSPSASSVQTPLVRRNGKGKKQPGMVSDSLEPDGHLPGYKDGVGVFPPGSEWAELMLSLKLKGKFVYHSCNFVLKLRRAGQRQTVPYEEGAIENREVWAALYCGGQP